jgi:hypothetical protein
MSDLLMMRTLANSTQTLDACLLTDEEMALGADGWSKLPDPFQCWELTENPGDDRHEKLLPAE